MDQYSYANFSVVSSVALDVLRSDLRVPIEKPDFFVDLLPSSPRLTDFEWSHDWTDASDTPVLSLAEGSDSFLLRFPNIADFLISKDWCRIGVYPYPETSQSTLRHLLLDQVLPRLLAHKGFVVTHASAVRVGNRVIAFVGETGSGKSTLAASFYVAGASVFCDDSLILSRGKDTVLALPTYTGLRLWPDALAQFFSVMPEVVPMADYTAKQSVILSGDDMPTIQPLPLAGLYFLKRQASTGVSDIFLTRLSARDACMAMIRNSFQLDVTDRRRNAALFMAVSDLVLHVPVFSLFYPRDFEVLPAVRKLVLNNMTDGHAGASTII